MSSSTNNLKEAVTRLGRPDVELVDVYTPSSQVALLRVKTMPEYAFLLDVPKGSSGSDLSSVYFVYPDKTTEKLMAVCACCHTELEGIEVPEEYKQDPRHPWYKAMTDIFRTAVAKACQENGIQTIFTRHGKKAWDHHYGKTPSLTVESKEAFVSVMGQKYPTEAIKFLYNFLDPGSGIG